MKSAFLLVTLFLSLQLHAQSWPWGFKGGAVDDSFNAPETILSLVTDSQKNIYALARVGYTGIFLGNQLIQPNGDAITKNDVVLFSLSCSGELRWYKVFGGSSYEIVGNLAIDENDNIYFAGSVLSCAPVGDINGPAAFFGEYSFDNSFELCNRHIIAKLNPNGNFIWVQRPQEFIPQTEALQSTTVDLLRAPDGTLHWLMYLSAGTYCQGQYTVSSNSTKYHILKFNENGVFLSGIPINITADVGPLPKFYRNPNNGHYFFTNYRDLENEVSFNGTPLTGTGYLASYDQNGSFLWVRQTTSPTQVFGMSPHSIDFDSENNIYIAGNLTNTTGNNSFLGYALPAVNGQNIRNFVMKTNPTADNYIWAFSSNQSSSAIGTAKLLNNEFYWFGIAGQTVTWSGQSFIVSSSGNGRHFAAKFNLESGACTGGFWIPSTQGGLNYLETVTQDASGDLILGGQFTGSINLDNNQTLTQSGGASDFIIAKYATQACSPLNLEELPFEQVQLYPNPVKDVFVLHTAQAAQFQIISLNGTVLKKGNANQGSNSIQVSDIPTGIYICKIIFESGETQTKKVAIKN